MRLIEGLGSREAVAVGDKFIVSVGHYPWAQHVDIGGTRRSGGCSSGQFLVDSLDNISLVFKGEAEKFHVDPGSGEAISREKWQELYNGKYADPESPTGFTYPSLDAEFEHRKFQQELLKWETIESEAKERLEKIEFTVIGSMDDTGDELIETSIHIGRKNYKESAGCPFLVRSAAVAVRAFDRLQSSYPDLLFSREKDRGYLRYAKVNGQFAFDDQYPFRETSIRLFLTLEEAKAEVEAIEKNVLKHVERARLVNSLNRLKVEIIWNLTKLLVQRHGDDPAAQTIINLCEGRE